MDEGVKYPWQQTVVDAFLASAQELPDKIQIAERAILGRLKESRLDVFEKMALNDALRAVDVLMTEARKSRPRNSGEGQSSKAG